MIPLTSEQIESIEFYTVGDGYYSLEKVELEPLHNVVGLLKVGNDWYKRLYNVQKTLELNSIRKRRKSSIINDPLAFLGIDGIF